MCVWQRHHDFTVCLLFERMNFLVSWGWGAYSFILFCAFLHVLRVYFSCCWSSCSSCINSLYRFFCIPTNAIIMPLMPVVAFLFLLRDAGLGFSLGSCCASQLKCEMLLSKANKSLHSDNNELCIMFAVQNRFLFLTVK